MAIVKRDSHVCLCFCQSCSFVLFLQVLLWKKNTVLSKILSALCFLTSSKHFMDGMDGFENDPQCIRECVVHYFVLFAVYNGPGQHLTRMEAHQGRPIRT